ncbi:MAG: ribosome-associated translation inhibitor RaiA [Erysipelotrichaceae bacterium]|nr:ribosome-associated translation inhibitor RaiA [Erysipelotrichaceae bacterium]MDD3924027.1 ribosome-associated translation inhibitor RaiA [Erysipelotrichaceae bacterium]MDD4642576.1 ribosome-associated translation inhibitor RaiA [Erysipelotrichaceae bacterium]
MKFYIYGQNVSITEAMQKRIEKKLSFLEKYFIIDDETVANVIVKIYPLYQKIEVTIPTKVGILRAEVAHDDLYAAIDLAVDKLEDQIRRQKTRLSRKHREKLALAFLEEEDVIEHDEDDEVVRTKVVKLERMDLDEAILRMEMLGHTFFLYKDAETNAAAVVYKRNDGGYGLIETE